MEKVAKKRSTPWRWFQIYDPMTFLRDKERYIIEKIVKAIITVWSMEREYKKGKMEQRPFVKERKRVLEQERKRGRKRKIRRRRTSFPPSFPHLYHLREENSSLARSRKRRKEEKEEEATDELWEKEGKEARRSVYFFMVAGMRASMGLPSAASFSISMRRATPSQTNWRSSTSE